MSGLRPVQKNPHFAMPQVPQQPQQATSGSSGSGLSELYNFDVLDMIKRKFWLICFFTLVGIGLSILFFFQAPKTYRSTAKVILESSSVPDVDLEETQSTVERDIEILRSSKTLTKAIAKLENIDKMSIFEEVDSPVAYLRDGNALITKSADVRINSGAIKISFDGSNPAETQEVLEAIVDAYGEYIAEESQEKSGKVTAYWKSLHKDILEKLPEVQAQIEEQLKNPELLVVNGEIQNKYQMQQGELVGDKQQLIRDRTRLQARVETIQSAQAEGRNLDSLVIGMMQEFNEASMTAYASTNSRFVELKMKEQELLQEYGSRHPELENIRRQISVVDKLRMEELSTIRGETAPAGSLSSPLGNSSRRSANNGSNNTQPANTTNTMVAQFVEQMTSQIDLLKAQERSLQVVIDGQQLKAAETAAEIEKVNFLLKERDRLEAYSLATIDKLSGLDVLEGLEGREMDVLNPPSNAEQVAPSLPLCLAGGLFLGSLLGLAFAGVKEMAEKTFRSSEDVSTILGTRVIGHVDFFQRTRPRKDSPFANVAPEVIALHQPSNLSCEAYRSIRTSIFFAAQQTGAQVIQLTSPTPGDGKSTTISNLAASMAQSGRKVLVIDADFRKPRQHKYFGLDNSFGMTSVICGEMEPEDAVQVVQPEYLSVVACGPIPPNPSELITSARFEAVISSFREKYDFILIDTPPLLAVTDPAIVCRYVDLVYMVMRITNGVRANSLRAKEVVDSMGVDVSGVIINGLRRRDQKVYDYKGGRYGYGGANYGSYGNNYAGKGANASKPVAAGNLVGPGKS